MKDFRKLFTFALGATIGLAQMASSQTPNAATDPRINPQVRVLLGNSTRTPAPLQGTTGETVTTPSGLQVWVGKAGNPFWIQPMCYTRLSCSRLLRTLLSVS